MAVFKLFQFWIINIWQNLRTLLRRLAKSVCLLLRQMATSVTPPPTPFEKPPPPVKFSKLSFKAVNHSHDYLTRLSGQEHLDGR